MNICEFKGILRDLDDLYSEMQSGVCSELDSIRQGINNAWDSESKDEYLQKTSVLAKLLDETAEDIKQLKEKLVVEYRKSVYVSEHSESEESTT